MIILLLFPLALKAQEVQWASKVVRYSSQYGNKQFSAQQVEGRPNMLPNFGSSPVAWAPARESAALEYVEVAFEQPMRVQQIAVAENLNPGAIYRIHLIDSRRKFHVVYENKEPGGFMGPGRMFRHFISLTDFEVHGLKLDLKTNAVPGMNQIDAIGISASKNPIQAYINLVEYKNHDSGPENLGPNVNTRYEDRYPIVSPDGNTLYFARKEQPDPTQSTLSDAIFYSERDDRGNWSPARNIGEPLNTKNHNYVIAVSPDGNTLYLANEYTRLMSEGVSISNRNGDSWSRPKGFRIRSMYNNNMFSCYHVNPDEDIIVMAIEQEDSHGDMDIYVSFREDGDKWTAPKNLGPGLNTAGIEGSAFLAADNITLYFSSNGHAGYGGMDLFMSRRLDESWTRWSEPVNLGRIINSQMHEYNLTIPASGEYAYFASSNSQYGASDIYRILMPQEVRPLPVALLQAQAVDAETGKPLDATLRSPEGEKRVKGKFGLVLPMHKDFRVTTEVPGYYPNTKDNSVEPDDDTFMDFDEADEQETALRQVKENVYERLRKRTPEATGDPAIADEEVRREVAEKMESVPAESIPQAQRPELEKKMADDIAKQLATEQKDPEYVEMTGNIEMMPIREGQVIRINNIFFKANESFLLGQSFEELGNVVRFLEQNPGVYVEIGGHTNGLPSDDFCNTLSNARAMRVYDYLVQQGIDEKRLTYKGYGKTKPIATNSTLDGRKQNQRVELTIMRVERR